MKTPLALLAVLALITSWLFAQGGGPLTPPGAPGVTMKTLQEIEPRTPLISGAANTAAVTTDDPAYHFIINQPGSYYLTGNLAVTKPNGIDIRAKGVTLDLGGFEIGRTAGTGGNGVEVDYLSFRCTVKNGTVTGFDYGLRCIFFTLSSYAGTAAQLSVGNNTQVGILAGDGWEITGCEVHQNNGGGIVGGRGVTITNCTAHLNIGGSGITAGTGSTITGCTAHSNTGQSTDFGIVAGDGSTITACTAYQNSGGAGIAAGEGSTISRCTSYRNRNPGASLGFGKGIIGGEGSTITGCTARENAAEGITRADFQGGVTITDCTSSFNSRSGIDGGDRSTITHCTTIENGVDGIRLFNDCLVRGNTCSLNGGAGIFAQSSDNRFEDNQVTDNSIGIHVTATGSLIIKNSASGNTTNYSIAPNNRYGPIIDITPAGTAAVNGSSAADTTTTTHPWANFSF